MEAGFPASTQAEEEAILVSVVIPTLDRGEILCDTLTCFFDQTYPRYEIIVVDQTERHPPEVADFLDRHRDRFRLIHLDTKSTPLAKNVGVCHASGEVVLFCDDDVIPSPDLIAFHVENYAEPIVGGVAGRVIEDGEPVVDTTYIGRVTLCGRLVVNHSSPHRAEVEWARGGNMSFRRVLVQRVGGFDTRFGNAGFEEIDFCFRLRRTGYKIVFDPMAALVHLHLGSGGCQTRTFDAVTYYSHFLCNKTLFYLKNMPHYGLPCFLLIQVLRAVKTGWLDNRSLTATAQLLRAIYEGATLYMAGEKG